MVRGIRGAEHWNDGDKYYTQENNPTEAYNEAVVNARRVVLESCGPTAAVNCLAALGHNLEITCPGSYRPQPEEVLMDFFNDPRNRPALEAVRVTDDSIPENRVPQFYPLAVRQVFGAGAEFFWGHDFNRIRKTVAYNKHPVQLCLKSPGHYIAVVAYDFDKGELIYNDPWSKRFKDGNGGFNRRMDVKEYQENVQPYFIEYGL